METCNICGCNAAISKCKTCLIKCCQGCFERHIYSCNILKDDKYHQCQYHEHLVKAFCCHCYQLICKECVVDNHVGHNFISFLDAYNYRDDIVKEFIGKQQEVNSYIDACKETRRKYCLLETQIEEEEKHFQRCIGSVRDSLLQQMEPNIKQIEDQCRAGKEILKLQEMSPEDARQNQKFPLIYLGRLSRYRNGLNAFEKQYISCDILANLRITQSREDVYQVFLSKFVETVSTCDKANTHYYGTNDNRVDTDPIALGVHTPTIPDMADQSFAGDPQQQTTHNDSDGDVMKKLEEMLTELGEHKRDRAFILEFFKSFPETVDKIERMTEVSSTDIVVNVPREENIDMVRFSEAMAHVFNSMKKIKNQLIKTEQDLKNKLSNIVNWTNDQGQSEKEEKRIHQSIVDDKNKQLEILKKDQAIKDEKIKQLETLNKDLHQRLQGKPNLKKLETECIQLKEEQAKLQNQRQQGAELYYKLCKENKDLQEGLKTAGEIINQSQKKVTDLENEVHGLKVTIEKKEHAIKALRAEKDDCLNRDPQQQTTHNDSDGAVIKILEEMSTELGEHKRERAYILEFLKSFPETVDKIERMTEVSSTEINLPRLDNIVMVRFSEGMEHVFNSMMKIKNQLIKTEQDLKNKISNIVNLTNDQGQSEKDEIRIHQGIVEAKNKQLEILKKDQAIKDGKIKQLETLNKDLHQRLQGKPNLKKLETECILLREEQAKLLNQRQQGAEQYHKLCKDNKDLQEGLRIAQEIIYESQKKVTDLENKVFGLKVTLEKKEHAIKALTEEKDDCLTRLSSITGDTGNQAIPALCDPNRPMKIAERFGELYDNEWTDVIDRTDEVKALYPDMKTAEIEVVIIRHLYQLLMCCYRECLALSKEQLLNVGKMVLDALKLNTKGHGRNMFGCKEVSNIRRQGAAEYADYLFQHKVLVDKIVLSDWQYVHKSNELVGLLTKTPFFEKCIHICWHMATKDPVMHLDEELTPDTVYDKSVYREFVKSGDKVTFVVWPALFLHEGGPLLNKGVVQAY